MVIPAVLHVEPLKVLDYPPVLRQALREWVLLWIAGGQMNPMVVKANG